MGKNSANSKKSMKQKKVISKSQINKRKSNKNNKRIIKKKNPDENEFITDLSFIDKYEEEEKNRIIKKEEENNIENRNKKLYKLKICYRPLKNNIELIGKYFEKSNDIKGILIDETSNQCCYLLNKDNNIIVPIAVNEILNKKTEKNNLLNDEKRKLKLHSQKKIIKKYQNAEKNSFFYLHISKKNIINCILLNESHIINFLNIFLSGNYSGFFEEIKNDKKVLKTDNFDIYLNKIFLGDNEAYHNFEVIGKGKDEYGEYIIKGNINLIKDLEEFKKGNNFKNMKNINNKVINFGEMIFNKIYNI